MSRLKISQLIALFLISLSFIVFTVIWLRGGFATIYLDTDIGRDLSEISNILRGRIVWLGPRLSAGFPASPIYYYLFAPAVWLAGGDARALVIFNVALALGALGWLAFWGWRQWGKAILVPVWLLALIPFWDTTSIHPGNGYTYVFWLLASLVSLYFQTPFWLSSVLMGTAIALHPAAVLALPVLGYELWRRRQTHKLRWQLPQALLGLALPWAPILAYEAITKFYLLRSFVAHPASGYSWQLGLENVYQLAHLWGLEFLTWLSLWLVTGLVATRRLKIWWTLTTVTLALVCVVASLPSHYLLGLATTTLIIMILAFMRHKVGVIFLAFLAVFFLRYQYLVSIPAVAGRSIPSLERTISYLDAQEVLSAADQIAVVAVMSHTVEVPQADDYRFFLRSAGYQVLEVAEYGQADTLIMFIEVPNFNWQTWNTWETDQFGARQVVFEQQINHTQVIVFKKQ